MLRPSPNHGTQRLPNDDDDDPFNQNLLSDIFVYLFHRTYIVHMNINCYIICNVIATYL